MEGLIDNAKKFMASEEGQKMQATFEQKGGADVDQFLGQNKSSSSGDNVNVSKSSGGDFNEPSYGSGSNTSNQYSAQRQNQDLLNDGERDGPRGSDDKKAGGRDTGVVGDAGAAKTRERDHDYSGYGGEDSTAEGGWGANRGGKESWVVLKICDLMSLSSDNLQNQLGADQPESGGNGQSGRTGDNDGNYDGGRQAGNFDASGTSTPAYRQQDGDDVADDFEAGKGSSGKVHGQEHFILDPYGDNSTEFDMNNPLHEQHRSWSQEQEQAAWDANIRGGIKGALLAAGITIPGTLALQRFSATYRQLPIPAKAFAATIVAVPCIVISAETAGMDYERSLWEGTGKREIDRKAQADIERWDRMSGADKFQDWAKRNQWSLVGGGWAASMLVSGAILARNPYMSFSQKLVQARVYAQASTLATLIITGILAGTANKESKPMEEEDHSWRDILEDEEREKKAHEAEANKGAAKAAQTSGAPK
ncbi:hypothetical protein QFC20_002375 [Naganishia adeliensis]|uniref:Uncharacterized protein n=1 Tax=Naganishia adeliensis TaxID=92952 RepID=A0ACC2WKC2_9TREE|nr:hypothetical protein QFC20_002375 [Naganishia adeliensis]